MGPSQDRPVLVLGATGQVGGELAVAAWPSGLIPHVRGRDQVDLSDKNAIETAVMERDWAFVVNAAAYTAVDKAEDDVATAMAINRDAVGWLAEACAARNLPLLHISTDYVFDGTKTSAYHEDDPVAPLGIYGASKEAGEALLRGTWKRHVILRTAWVFSARGHNFVKTMVRLGQERDELRVVADQHGCPTAARDIARAIIEMIRQILTEDREDAWGTYHFAGLDPTTWHDFAEAIMVDLKTRTGRRPTVHAITTAEYPTLARRPANSVLACDRINGMFGIQPSNWRDTLADVLTDLHGEGR
jgi:dTDP-4-dehydrorhamnose reductase